MNSAEESSEERRREEVGRGARETLDLFYDFIFYHVPCTSGNSHQDFTWENPEPHLHGDAFWSEAAKEGKRRKQQRGRFVSTGEDEQQRQPRQRLLQHLLRGRSVEQLISTIVRNYRAHAIGEREARDVGKEEDYVRRNIALLAQQTERNISLKKLVNELWWFRHHIWMRERDWPACEIALDDDVAWEFFSSRGFQRGGGKDGLHSLLSLVRGRFPCFASKPAYFLKQVIVLGEKLDGLCEKRELFGAIVTHYEERRVVFEEELSADFRLSETLADGEVVAEVARIITARRTAVAENIARVVREYYARHGFLL